MHNISGQICNCIKSQRNKEVNFKQHIEKSWNKYHAIKRAALKFFLLSVEFSSKSNHL